MKQIARFLVLGMAVGVAFHPAWSAELVKGSVLELGSDGTDKGVSGVTVNVIDGTTNDSIGKTVTLKDGSYEVRLTASPSPRTTVFFDKPNYVKRKAQQLLTDPKQKQSVLYLAKTGISPLYAKAAVANILRQSSAGAGGADGMFGAVLSLPEKDKREIFRELKLEDAALYDRFKAADDVQRLADDLSAKIRSGSYDPKYSAIGVYPNFEGKGTVRLYGHVDNMNSLREIEGITKQLTGAKVLNDVMIKN